MVLLQYLICKQMDKFKKIWQEDQLYTYLLSGGEMTTHACPLNMRLNPVDG